MAIPKIIHYCWFGNGDYPDKVKKCLKSWKKHLIGYRFVAWNEENFDINSTEYTKEAYLAGKWAYVSDYARLYALYTMGGVYMDTDIEVLKDISPLLECDAFSVISKTPSELRTNFMGASAGHPWMKNILEYYNDKHFILADGKYDMTPNICVGEIARDLYAFKATEKEQRLKDGVVLYPTEVSGAYDFETGKLDIRENSYVIHWNSASWWDEGQREQYFKEQKYRKVFGVKNGNRIIEAKRIIRQEGIGSLIMKCAEKVKR